MPLTWFLVFRVLLHELTTELHLWDSLNKASSKQGFCGVRGKSRNTFIFLGPSKSGLPNKLRKNVQSWQHCFGQNWNDNSLVKKEEFIGSSCKKWPSKCSFYYYWLPCYHDCIVYLWRQYIMTDAVSIIDYSALKTEIAAIHYSQFSAPPTSGSCSNTKHLHLQVWT